MQNEILMSAQAQKKVCNENLKRDCCVKKLLKGKTKTIISRGARSVFYYYAKTARTNFDKAIFNY